MTAAAPVETQTCTDIRSITTTSRRSWLMICLEGCGAGILLMLRNIWSLITPSHPDFYHWRLPMNTVFGGAAIDLILACLLCGAALWLLERFDAEGHTVLWAVVAIILAIHVGGFATWIDGGFATLIKAVTLAFIILGPLAWLWLRPWYGKRAVPVFRGSLVMMGFCIFWVLPELVYMAVNPEPHDVQKLVRTVPPVRAPQRRIVWILFDELSQDQIFDHRQPGISLPQLDHFRSQSVMFSDVQPAGYKTEDVLPSLLWKKEIRDIRSNLRGDLSVKTSDGWRRMPAEQTLFADAQREGWSTGVAGWYNAYCRTYAQSLDWCAWVGRFTIPGNYSPQKSIWWNVGAPLLGNESIYPAKNHAADYSDLARWAHELIEDEDIGFVFLHLPLPHPSGFYDRKMANFGVDGSYLDNLALTDLSLGQLMQWISHTSLAPKTTVILCSDHSWRVPMWDVQSGWTKEDQKASGGKFDPRPVLMVHFPGETTPYLVSKSFPALKEHDLIESLLHQPMTATELKDWAQR